MDRSLKIIAQGKQDQQVKFAPEQEHAKGEGIENTKISKSCSLKKGGFET